MCVLHLYYEKCVVWGIIGCCPRGSVQVMGGLYKAGKLISEQSPGEPNPLLQLAIDPSHMTQLVKQLSHSAHSLRPRSTRPWPAQPGTYSVHY